MTNVELFARECEIPVSQMEMLDDCWDSPSDSVGQLEPPGNQLIPATDQHCSVEDQHTAYLQQQQPPELEDADDSDTGVSPTAPGVNAAGHTLSAFYQEEASGEEGESVPRCKLQPSPQGVSPIQTSYLDLQTQPPSRDCGNLELDQESPKLSESSPIRFAPRMAPDPLEEWANSMDPVLDNGDTSEPLFTQSPGITRAGESLPLDLEWTNTQPTESSTPRKTPGDSATCTPRALLSTDHESSPLGREARVDCPSLSPCPGTGDMPVHCSQGQQPMQELPTSAQVTSSVNNTQQKMAQLSPQRAQEAPSGQGGAEAGEPSSSSDRFEIFRVCSASVPMFIGSQQACEKHPEVSSRNKEAPEKASCLAMRVEPPRAACIATASPSDGENPAEVAWKVRVRPSSAAIHRLQQVLAEGMAMDPQTEAVDGARVQDANVVGSPTSQSKEREAVCRDRLLGKRPCTQEEGPEAAAPRCRAVVAAANRAAQAQSFCQDALQHKICCMAPPQDNESRTALKEKIRTGMDLVMWRWNIK